MLYAQQKFPYLGFDSFMWTSGQENDRENEFLMRNATFVSTVNPQRFQEKITDNLSGQTSGNRRA